jgi:hypothetical protein
VTVALGAAGVAWAAPLAASAQAAADDGAWILDTRLRYETVSQDGLADADALTFRARFGYETQSFHGVRALIEAEGVTQLNDEFRSCSIKRIFAWIARHNPSGMDASVGF